MKLKSIGIVGGAGPMAGAALLERVLSLAGSTYGCYKDSDFPRIFLLSFPFSEMLTPEMDVEQLKKELRECLNQLRNNGADVLAIACNTLHAFLDQWEDQKDLVHLPNSLVNIIPPAEIPLVLCTTTSVKFGLHKQYFRCDYPNPEMQRSIDTIIDRVLRGSDEEIIVQDLLDVLQNHTSKTIILGCTELSLFAPRLQNLNKTIIDPLEVAANELLRISFNNIEGGKKC